MIHSYAAPKVVKFRDSRTAVARGWGEEGMGVIS